MMSRRILGTIALAGMLAAACEAKVAVGGPSDETLGHNDGGAASGGGGDGGGGGSGGGDSGSAEAGSSDGGSHIVAPQGTLARAQKIDLLLAIDNSSSMGDKQALLRQAIPDLVGRLLNPYCLDATGAVVGTSTGGACATGVLEFMPVTDLHVGIVSSSLGGRGANLCDGTDTVGTGGTRHDDDHGHLLTRASAAPPIETTLADAPNGVLAFGPGKIQDPARFIDDLKQMVAGVGEYGCGIEAQMESWYRFLVQPDPYDQIVSVGQNRRDLSGVDGTILAQRAEFLRPDSLVAIVVVTDEDDSAFDPRAIGGQGWAYANTPFPGKLNGPTHGGAARGTSACATNPLSIDCTSCGFGGHEADPACQVTGDGQPGYYADAEDSLNTRFFHMRARYGVDPQFPISRYIYGLSSAKVPNRDGEHAPLVLSPSSPVNDTTSDYLGTPNCDNPLFSRDLPTDPNADLCHLTPGPRSANLVLFATITGVPNALLASPLDDAAWTRITGKDPARYDYSGADPHMIQSQTPRAGLPGPTSADNADPMNGREWETAMHDLQFACTFDLPAPRDCSDPRVAGTCDCAGSAAPPLCDAANHASQVRGKAYPGIRQLAVARALGSRAVVASICADTKSVAPEAQAYGFRPALNAFATTMRGSLVLP